jgi:hypothetical protein
MNTRVLASLALSALPACSLLACANIDAWDPTLLGIDGDAGGNTGAILFVFSPQNSYFTPLAPGECPERRPGGSMTYPVELSNELRTTALVLVRMDGPTCDRETRVDAAPSEVVRIEYNTFDVVMEVRDAVRGTTEGRWLVTFDPTGVRPSRISARSLDPAR